MGVYIKGMEMPQSCWRCLLSQLYEKPREMLVCKITHEEVLRHKIDSNCPLVPVPPHGRLIDADALIAWFEEWYDPNADLEICHVIDILDDNSVTPTILEAEEGE